MSLKYDYTIKL